MEIPAGAWVVLGSLIIALAILVSPLLYLFIVEVQLAVAVH